MSPPSAFRAPARRGALQPCGLLRRRFQWVGLSGRPLFQYLTFGARGRAAVAFRDQFRDQLFDGVASIGGGDLSVGIDDKDGRDHGYPPLLRESPGALVVLRPLNLVLRDEFLQGCKTALG